MRTRSEEGQESVGKTSDSKWPLTLGVVFNHALSTLFYYYFSGEFQTY